MPLIGLSQLFIIFLIFGFGKCEDTNNSSLKETYVSPIEKSIRLVINTGQKFNNKVTRIKEAFRNVMYSILTLKREVEKRNTTISSVFNPFKSKIKAIFPGTYWCGDGDISPNKEDLGYFESTDACCRAHDLCPDDIPSKGTRSGLLNNGIFTRLSCECDDAFYRCLKNVDNIVASKVGLTYFNILKPQCFKNDSSNYSKYSGKYIGDELLDSEYVEYNFNHNLSESIDWFDNPKF